MPPWSEFTGVTGLLVVQPAGKGLAGVKPVLQSPVAGIFSCAEAIALNNSDAARARGIVVRLVSIITCAPLPDQSENPGIVEGLGIKSSEEHQAFRQRVVVHACGVSGAGFGDRMDLRPIDPVPSPGLVLNGGAKTAAKYHHQPQAGVIGNGRVCAWGRSRCRKPLCPGRSVPNPSVVVLNTKVLNIAAKQHDRPGNVVVSNRSPPRGRTGSGKLLGPSLRQSIPGPSVSENVVVAVHAAKQHGCPGGRVVRNTRLVEPACRRRYGWKLLGPGASIPGPGVVKRCAAAAQPAEQHNVTRRPVVEHSRAPPRRWRRGGEVLRPPIPKNPGIAVNRRIAPTAKQHGGESGLIVSHTRATPAGRG